MESCTNIVLKIRKSAGHQQEQRRCDGLQDEPAGHHLLVAPAHALAHMVVQRREGVLEDADVEEALEADLQDAEAAVYDEHQRRQQEGERVAALEGQDGEELQLQNVDKVIRA